MAEKIIKKDGKFYIEEITENEVTLEELQKEKADLEASKQIELDNQSKACEDAIGELEILIAQFEELLKEN